MAAIHEPVPRYDDIATAVDRFSTVSNRVAGVAGELVGGRRRSVAA